MNKNSIVRPIYKGDGNHSPQGLEKLCEQYDLYCSQEQLIKQRMTEILLRLLADDGVSTMLGDGYDSAIRELLGIAEPEQEEGAETDYLPYDVLRISGETGKILSIRRISDGAIFDTGEQVVVKMGEVVLCRGKIDQIWLDKNQSSHIAVSLVGMQSVSDLRLIQHDLSLI